MGSRYLNSQYTLLNEEVSTNKFGDVKLLDRPLKDIKIFVDHSLERFQNIFAAAGHPNCVFKIDFENLVKITKGKIENITE